MPTPGYDTFPSIPALKAACRAANNYFFSKGAMEFFKSRVETGILRGRYFVTSEQISDGNPREYSVRVVTRYPDGRIDIETLGERHATKQLARNAALQAAKDD